MMGEAHQERIVAAAIKIGDVVCHVQRPGRHHDVFAAMDGAGFRDRIGPDQQGFITNTGRFVAREVARQIAIEANQLIKSDKDNAGVPIVRQHNQLFSEDVW